jgi:integrase
MVKRDSRRFTFSRQAIEALPTPKDGEREIYYDDPGRTGKGVRGLCLRVTAGARTFYVQRKFEGRQERYTLGQFPAVGVDAARARALAALADYARGESPVQAKHARRAALVGQLTLGEVWDDYRANRKRKRTGADSRSLEHQWGRYLKPWAGKTLAELDAAPDQVRGRILKIRRGEFTGTDKDGKAQKYGGPGQANRVQRMGKAMVNHAARNLRWHGGNPFDFDQLSERGRERVRTPTHDEARRLMAAFAKLQNRTAGDFFLMLAYTGQRAGTVRRMKYADVDLETGHWRVGVTKSGAVHRMVLPTAALELVKRRQKDNKDGAFVFPGRKPGACYAAYKTAWRRVLEIAEIEGLRVHDLRRLSATAEHEAGVLKQIQARLAHKSGAMTRRYVAAEAGLERLMKDATLAAILGTDGAP